VGHNGEDGWGGGIGLALILRDNVDVAKPHGMVGSEGQAEAMLTPDCSVGGMQVWVGCKCGWGASVGGVQVWVGCKCGWDAMVKMVGVGA
jgi:hypothetical protein